MSDMRPMCPYVKNTLNKCLHVATEGGGKNPYCQKREKNLSEFELSVYECFGEKNQSPEPYI